jgi:hypothetical protein
VVPTLGSSVASGGKDMMRRILVGAIVVVALGLVPAVAATSTAVVSESFEDGPDGVFSAGAWGMEPLADGRVGPGLRSIIPAGEHWGSKRPLVYCGQWAR